MQREDVIKTVNNFLVEEIEIEENLLKEEALLKEDLGIDSLDFVDIVVIHIVYHVFSGVNTLCLTLLLYLHGNHFLYISCVLYISNFKGSKALI